MPPKTRNGEVPSKGKGHDTERTGKGDRSVTQPGAKSARAKSRHQTTPEDQEDPLQDVVLARNLLIQGQRELSSGGLSSSSGMEGPRARLLRIAVLWVLHAGTTEIRLTSET